MHGWKVFQIAQTSPGRLPHSLSNENSHRRKERAVVIHQVSNLRCCCRTRLRTSRWWPTRRGAPIAEASLSESVRKETPCGKKQLTIERLRILQREYDENAIQPGNLIDLADRLKVRRHVP
jgi:hypothetical protein